MNSILSLLSQLDDLYYTDLIGYEQQWPQVCQHIETFFPGFTLSHAEIYTEGQERTTTDSMRHVLLPK